MTNKNEVCKLNVFGDTYLKYLCPVLKANSSVEVEHEVTIIRGTVERLHRKLIRYYSGKNIITNDCTALIMIGSYDIMNFRNPRNFTTFIVFLEKSMTKLIEFLEQNHKRLVVLTVLPALRREKQKMHWKLVRRYNKYIRSLSAKPNVTIVDVFPMFVNKASGRTCVSLFYANSDEYSTKDRYVVWNRRGIERTLDSIMEALEKAFGKLSKECETIFQQFADDTLMI